MKRKLKQLQDVPFIPEVQKRIDKNTVYYTAGKDCEIIRLHKTDIFIKDGDTITLNSGGYQTKKTKSRINKAFEMFDYPDWSIESDRGVWILYNSKTGKEFIFYDRMRLKYVKGDFKSLNASKAPTKKQLMELRNDVRKYSKTFIEKLMNDEIPRPNDGHCWYCSFFLHESSQHILSHVREPYYVPTLLYNSVFDNHLCTLNNEIKRFLLYKLKMLQSDKINDNEQALFDFFNISDSVRKYLESNLRKFVYRKLSMPI